MMETMQTPTTRAEFERRFHLLREQMRKGKFLIARGMSTGLEKVRFLPNSRIDFLSVNETARLQANMMVQFQSEEFKEKLKTRGPKDSSQEHTEDAPKE